MMSFKPQTRQYTNLVLEKMEEGFLDKETLVRDLLNWMSEDDVEEFCDAYAITPDWNESEED